jgi:hypothetical protein
MPDPLYPAFVLLLLYGMRRGEVLGLSWQDMDLDSGLLGIRQQLQRVSVQAGPVKRPGRETGIPIPGLARAALLARQQQQAADRQAFGRAWQDTKLVFHHAQRGQGYAADVSARTPNPGRSPTRSGTSARPASCSSSFARVAFDVPYARAIVDLDEGYQGMTNLIGLAQDAIIPGGGLHLPYFRPRGTALG